MFETNPTTIQKQHSIQVSYKQQKKSFNFSKGTTDLSETE